MIRASVKKRIGKDLHLCWFVDCQGVWRLDEAEYCPTCDTWKCPVCHRCFCNLPREVQFALDAEGASSWGWRPWENLPKRKKRRSGVTWVCVRCGRHHPDAYVSEHGFKCAWCGGELRLEIPSR